VNEADVRVGLSYGATGMWLVVVALLIARPLQPRDLADRPSRLWPLLIPYTPVLVLFALTISQISGKATALQAASAIVFVLVMARQTVAIREVREVVEKQRNDLVASVSHELRTPLTGVVGFVEILRANPDLDRDERVEMIDIIASQTHVLKQTVTDLLEIAQGNLSQTRLAPQDLVVSDLVTSTIDILSDRSAAATITVHIEPGLAVRADPDKLRHILLNYLANAASYGRGTIEVYATATPDGVLFEVHDNGPGVPKKYEVRIWDRFERGAQTNLSQVPGSGLGLAIVHDLVAAHHGHSGHRPSERLGGACFWLTIPSSHGRKLPAIDSGS
jgi:signal transduction histidine kinase